MKKALLTTTALVALSGAAFADSVAVVNGGTSHHTHSPSVVFHGTANINYTVPLKTTTNLSPEGTVGSDVDLDVTMTSLGQYSATISYGIENNNTHPDKGGTLMSDATITVTTPLATISVGVDDANGGGADASDLFADIDRMTGVGTDEDSSDWYVSVPMAGWTIAASGDNVQTTDANRQNTSIGLTGSVGNLNITAGGKYKSGGASVSTNLMGATVKAAVASMRADGATTNTSESGIEVALPMGPMTVTVNSTTVDSSNFWGVEVATKISGFDITVSTDSEEENTFSLKGPLGPVKLHIDYDSDNATLTDTVNDDATVEAGITYDVPGTKGTQISASYSNDDDDFDAGTQVKMSFSF